MDKDNLHFKGVGGANKETYEVNLKFLHEVNPDTVKYAVRPRCIEFAIEKVGMTFFFCLFCSDADPHTSNVDPDPAFELNADPDPDLQYSST